MEHLDLAGYITTPTTHWTLPAFEQQDAIYLSSSRQMLEPILEETSEDEEFSQNSWSQYDHTSHVWSSTESETGSVIRIEITKDPDSISERDFACPAKRPRRSDEFLNTLSQQPSSLDDTVLLRRNLLRSNETFGGLESLERNSLERFLAFEAASRDSLGASSQQRSSTGSRRFDDFYSDSDSLSYHSLSRSSSLIQFESLERQTLQDQHSSLGSLGNSSPSLLSFDGGIEETRESAGEIARSSSGGGSGGNSGCNSGSNSRRGSQNSLQRRFESTDGRLHQTYYELDKLNFDDDKETDHFGSGHFGGASKCGSSMEHIVRSSAAEVKSDSESSTSSASSGNSILTASKPSAEDLIDTVKKSSAAARTAAFQRGGSGGKNSAENLSEDSGYCEPSQSLRRSKSKSIPKNFEKFSEEDEFFNDDEPDDDGVEEEEEQIEVEDEDDDSQNTHSKNSTVIEHDICQPKIAALDATFLVESATTPSTKATATPETKPLWLYYDSIKNSAATRDTQQEQQKQPQQQWEQQKLKREQRLLAHSPSPVSDTGSTTSSSSCASANSFTWLPTHAHIQPKQQRQLMFKQLLPQTLDFPEHLRNSLPDIRDANGSFSLDDDDEEFFDSQFSSNCNSAKEYSYVVDSQKSIDPASACRLLPPPSSLNQNSRMRTCSLTDDSDTSAGETSSSSSTTETSSTSTTNTETDQSCLEQAVAAKTRKTKKTIAADIVGVESGRGSSVPNELDKIGRKKRSSKLKHSRIKTHNWTSESELSEAEENDDEFNGGERIRRSCSWTERRERNLQNFEGAFGIPKKRSIQTQSLGYMNASYINLTLLDYSGHEDIAATSKNRSNFKRAGWSSMESSSRKSAGDADYEGIICKGNFLLDELSEIYDKNASILNDKILESDEDEFRPPPFITKLETKLVVAPPNVSPKAPARQRAHSSTNYSDVNTFVDKPEVQHVQLTIRNPPARQKYSAVNQLEKVSNTPLSAEIQTNFSTFGKTFDQDPTNLRTSYAQSLEKCNFDANELSNADISQSAHAIPKRRFQSHAATNKKRNMVSSTPNLNAFDPGANELDDDMYVTSAHASMHQLPQGATGQKPLGILLPAGSRSSFGKEVSFCPVVSKYVWQEQSSEECNEPLSADRQDSKEEESTDDELLDNADATVIYNTKENEMIAANYSKKQLSEEHSEEQREMPLDIRVNEQQSAEEQKLRDPQRAMVQEREVAVLEKVRATIVSIAPSTTTENIAKTSTPQTTDDAAERAAQSVIAEKLVSNVDTEPTAVSQTTTTFAETTLTQRHSANESHTSFIDSNRNSTDNVNITTTHPTRPLSLHLPILSEPPTNRAHVLYASQQLINQLQDQQQSQIGGGGVGESARAVSAINLSTSPNVRAAFVTKMSKHGIVNYTDSPDGAVAKPYNNNNDAKGKFKSDEKHPSSKGFLSRFAHGFRFSLRRNKKKQLQQQQQQQQQEQPVNDQVATLEKYAKAEKSKVAQNGAKLGKATNSADFIFIPLKAPLPANNGATATVASSAHANRAGNGKHVSAAQPATTTMIVTGKPPLPKQPPRVEKLPPQQQQQSAGTPAQYNHNKTTANFATSQFYIATPVDNPIPVKATTIDECFLDSERSYYDDFKNQLNTGMQANGRMYAAATATGGSVSMDPNPSPAVDASSPSRASVSQKTQMFNNLSSGGAGAGAGASVNGKIIQLNNIGSSSNHHGKIGLIETNLDTHETVISGKTRSLMELGPQQQQQSRFKFIQRGGVHGAHGGYQADGDDDDDDDDVDAVVDVDGIDGAGVIVKGLPQQAGQIASVRRPHKSMEFLLDKENQKNVLPPENQLQKSHEQNPNALSEHQLRVQASLQRLNIPDWFRQYNQTTARSPDGSGNAYKPGNFTRKRTSESGRWTGLNSKTTSLSSLGSQRSDRSPLLLSPSAHSHHGGQSSAAVGTHPHHHQHVSGAQSAHGGYTGGTSGGGGGGNFSRWSTSHLNSSQTSPSCSQRGSFSRGGPVNSSFISVASGQSGMNAAVRSSFRQPYLGWRSQEKLSQRTPHERLASSLLAAQQQRITSSSQKSESNTSGGIKQLPVTPEIQSSIKEVTSAIVHYVNDQTQQQRSRSTSPNSRKCWLESSFVGTRPLDSPQTPVIENTATAFSTSAAAAIALQQQQQFNSNNTIYNNSSISSGYYNNSSATSSIHSAGVGTAIGGTTNIDVLRMNGLSFVGGGTGAPERSLSSASLEDVLASLLGLPSNTAGTGASTSDAYTRSTTADSASESLVTFRHMPQAAAAASLSLHVTTAAEQQRLRRRSEGDQKQQQQQQQQQHDQQQHQQQQISQNAKTAGSAAAAATSAAGATGTGGNIDTLPPPPRRVSLGDSSDSNNKTTSELQIKCRNTKCDQTATPTDAKKYYKSCHNCSHLYCSRECRRAHWEKHRKACLHSRASNLCRQVLATCKDDLDTQRHLSLLARKGFLSQGRGVVRVLFRSAESAEGFIKHGFQCMGEASYVRWPDLMPAEMGLELYSELLKLSTEYKPDSKMLIYVAICVVSEAPGTAQAPVKWERQLVSRCAKLKLCKTILSELEQQQQALQMQQPIALVAIPEPTTEILILTFNPSAHATATKREIVLSNILSILSRRGVFLRKHYPEIYQRLQSYADGQTDKFNPVTLHPRDAQTGQSFVCIIMPVHSESGIVKMPSVADGGNRVNTIDVGAFNALANLDATDATQTLQS